MKSTTHGKHTLPSLQKQTHYTNPFHYAKPKCSLLGRKGRSFNVNAQDVHNEDFYLNSQVPCCKLGKIVN
jgi:hypothetical protein